MQLHPNHSAEVLSGSPTGAVGGSECVYQAFTLAAIVLVLASVWIF